MLLTPHISKTTRRLTAIALFTVLITSCSSDSVKITPATIQDDALSSPASYLQKMSKDTSNRIDWQLLAIRAYLKQNDIEQATTLLSTIATPLSAQQQVEQQLLKSRLLAKTGQHQQAINQLNTLDLSALSYLQSRRYYQLWIALHEGSNTLDLVRGYVGLYPYLDENEQPINNELTWQTLLLLPNSQANIALTKADEAHLKGWLTLLSVYRKNAKNPVKLQTQLKQWQDDFNAHPAVLNMPKALQAVINFAPELHPKYAILLPMSGQAKNFSDAILKGFFAAKEATQGEQPQQLEKVVLPHSELIAPAITHDVQSPADIELNKQAQLEKENEALMPTEAVKVALTENGTQVAIYDTNKNSIAELVKQAEEEGATLIIGPLLKPQVTALKDVITPINILALNETDDENIQPNTCYFALSPEDEARDAASHIYQQKRKAPLLLVPRGELGHRLANAFSKQWQAQGGGEVLVQTLGTAAQLRTQINKGVPFEFSGTAIKAKSLAVNQEEINNGADIANEPDVNDKTHLTLNEAHQAERTEMEQNRVAVDAIYIVANRTELSLVKSLIDISSTSKQRPKLYASSRSSQAGLGADFRLEMEGLQFSDIPLIAQNNTAQRQQLAGDLASDYSRLRLYAMGLDTWQLARRFDEVKALPEFEFKGETGTLTTSANCVINRELPWLTFQRGAVVSAN